MRLHHRSHFCMKVSGTRRRANLLYTVTHIECRPYCLLMVASLWLPVMSVEEHYPVLLLVPVLAKGFMGGGIPSCCACMQILTAARTGHQSLSPLSRQKLIRSLHLPFFCTRHLMSTIVDLVFIVAAFVEEAPHIVKKGAVVIQHRLSR